jgi:hypothetical protein
MKAHEEVDATVLTRLEDFLRPALRTLETQERRPLARTHVRGGGPDRRHPPFSGAALRRCGSRTPRDTFSTRRRVGSRMAQCFDVPSRAFGRGEIGALHEIE